MLRFGLVFFSDPGSWLGGLNYFQNLLSALDYLEERHVAPVLFAGPGIGECVRKAFPGAEVIEAGWTIKLAGRGRLRRLLDRNGRAYRLLWRKLFRQKNIGVLSHTSILGDIDGIPMIGWIYDLQHRIMPELFSDFDRDERDRDFDKICAFCTTALVSSESIEQHVSEFFPRSTGKLARLRFVANTERVKATPVSDVMARYALKQPYFYLPGQFWSHKNHSTVIEALKLLYQAGNHVSFICSGGHHDYRNPTYYHQLMQRVDQYQLDGFRSLGPIPYEDVLGLMSGAIAVVNPSLFEGWNTGVEEAKSLGKAVVLSDIPVHREQNPDRAWYFHPNDPEDLATALSGAAANFDAIADKAHMGRAKAELPSRLRTFAHEYQTILLRAAGAGS